MHGYKFWGAHFIADEGGIPTTSSLNPVLSAAEAFISNSHPLLELRSPVQRIALLTHTRGNSERTSSILLPRMVPLRKFSFLSRKFKL
jgi:hypothetical protein